MHQQTEFQTVVTNDTTTLYVRGELDIAVADDLATAVAAVNSANLRVDLSDTTFIDSTGIGTLLQAKRNAEAAGQTVTICNAREIVLRAFTILGLSDVLD